MTANQKRRLIWGVVSLLVAAGLGFAFYPRPVPVDLVTVATGPLLTTVDEEGRTRVHDVFTLSAPVAGHLRRIEVHAGDSVTAQETVVAEIEPLDPSLLDPRSEAQAQAAVRAAEASRQLAAAELEGAAADLDLARVEHRRAVELVRDGTLAQRELDLAERSLKAATAQVTTAREAVRVSQFELDRARAQLLSPLSGKGAGDCPCIAITAPVSGRVLRIPDPSRRAVSVGEPLLEIGDPERLEVVVELLSSDAVQVDPGNRVLLERWGGDTPLEGRVETVEPFGFTKVSALGIEEQRVLVVIQLVSPPEEWRRLGHGYQVETRIVLWESDDALTIPLTALFRDGEAWAVLVEESGRARLRQVRLGHRNRRQAEVLEGLTPGERLVRHPSDRLVPGTRIAGRGRGGANLSPKE